MNLNTVKEFIQLAKSEGVAEISYEGKDFKLSFSFIGEGQSMTVPMVAPARAIVPSAPATPQAAAKSVETPANIHVITSPFVGTFYSSPAPGKPLYVKLGDKVKAGQALCVLEAMKIMNEIDADVAGEIVEICVENESLVEYGQALFKIRKA